MKMEKEFDKTDLILLLLFAKGPSDRLAEPLKGITRLMKLLFLVKEEGNAGDAFEFKAYKMGPFSSEVYPVLEFLQTFPSIESPLVLKNNKTKFGNKSSWSLLGSQNEDAALRKEFLDPSVNPEQLKAIDDLAGGNDPDSPALTGEEINAEFALSEIGLKLAKKLAEKEPELLEKAESIKKQYGAMSLKELLRYVYTRYPETTTESEIKSQIF